MKCISEEKVKIGPFAWLRNARSDGSPEPEHSVSFAGCTEGSAHQLSSVYSTHTIFSFNLDHKPLKARFLILPVEVLLEL